MLSSDWFTLKSSLDIEFWLDIILKIRHSKDANFTVMLVTCENSKPRSSTGVIIIGPEQIAEQNAAKNLPTFKEFIEDFHNLGRVWIWFWLGGALWGGDNQKRRFKTTSESENEFDHDKAVVRYSCLDCDFPKMDQICPDVESRKRITLRYEYNGYKNTTVDGKPCLNWIQARPTRKS